MSSKAIDRITLFKVPEEHIATVLGQYKDITVKAVKQGKPYILKASARKTYPDERTQGFTVCAQTTFASLEDMQFYDQGCEAHKALKSVVGPLKSGTVMTLYMDAAE